MRNSIFVNKILIVLFISNSFLLFGSEEFKFNNSPSALHLSRLIGEDISNFSKECLGDIVTKGLDHCSWRSWALPGGGSFSLRDGERDALVGALENEARLVNNVLYFFTMPLKGLMDL